MMGSNAQAKPSRRRNLLPTTLENHVKYPARAQVSQSRHDFAEQDHEVMRISSSGA